MEFKVENGQNLLAIGAYEFGSYLRFGTPCCVVLDAFGQYYEETCYATLPQNLQYRETIGRLSVDGLYENYSQRAEDLYQFIAPIVPFLKNGSYRLEFLANVEGREFHRGDKVPDIDALYGLKVKRNSKAWQQMEEAEKEAIMSGSMEDTMTYRMFGDEVDVYATQPEEALSADRIKYFENEIAKGKRPCIILFRSFDRAQGEFKSYYYLLDGHHKLKAYNNLKVVDVPIISISALVDVNDREFDLELLDQHLLPSHLEYVLEEFWDLTFINSYLDDVLLNPACSLHAYVKNGVYETFYDNGQIKERNSFKNNKAIGTSFTWHENGQLAREDQHSEVNNTFTQWYASGQIESSIERNDEGWITQRQFYVSGQLKLEQKTFSNKSFDIEHEIREYWENGKLKKESVRNSDENRERYWYELGIMEREIHFVGRERIEVKYWNEKGKLFRHEKASEYGKPLENVFAKPYTTGDVSQDIWTIIKWIGYGFAAFLLIYNLMEGIRIFGL